MKVVQYRRTRKLKVGDHILGYGTVTGFNTHGIETDTGYKYLQFPEGKSVPVVRSDLIVTS